MPFSFSWTNTDPADATPANLLGKDIRDLRAAIQERMDDQFCDPANPWSASDPTHPIIPASKILGNVANKIISLHHSAFKVTNGTGVMAYTEQYAQNVDGSSLGSAPVTLMAPVILPQGVNITGASIMVDPRGGGSVSAFLDVMTYNAANPGIGNIAAIASAGTAGVSIATQGGLNSPVTPLLVHVFRVVLNNFVGDGNRFYAAQVYYSTPDCRSTL